MSEKKPLLTVWGQSLDREAPLPEYPRPQLVRDSYMSLNGSWHFAVTDTDSVPETAEGRILVPFAPESVLSGADFSLMPGQFLWYSRSFILPEGFKKDRVFLNFGAVDQSASVYLNGRELVTHTGGYTPFTAELTSALLDEKNTVMIRVQDPTDSSWHMRGGQSLKPGGRRHRGQSGIWQSVWLESVPQKYIRGLHIRPQLAMKQLELTVMTDGGGDCSLRVMGRELTAETNCPVIIPVPEAQPWSPEAPTLYDLDISYGEDAVHSYFAMRSLTAEKDSAGVPLLFLNGQPYFIKGVLDSGLWPDGLYTAPSDEAMVSDISRAKELGFNAIRKRDKVEPARWYHHCDRLGMLVLQDIPAGGQTCLTPTKKLDDSLPLSHALLGRADAAGRWHFQKELLEIAEALYNFPCVVLWTLFNDGRGQFDSLQQLESLRTLDKDRLIDHCGGGCDQGIGEISSLHSYERRFKYHPDEKGRAVALSEYGGLGNVVPGHSPERGYSAGRMLETPHQLEDALIRLSENVAAAADAGLSAAVYRQLTDTDTELDGLISADRRVVKLAAETLRGIFSRR